MKAEVETENAHPDKPFIQAQLCVSACQHTIQQSMATAMLKAIDSCVACVKQSMHMSNHKLERIRKSRRWHAPDNNQQQDTPATHGVG